MSVTSKSPLGVGREALAIGSATLRDYARRFSPKTYTQPQLFAWLVLKTFLKTDYRGICCILKEWTGKFPARRRRAGVGLTVGLFAHFALVQDSACHHGLLSVQGQKVVRHSNTVVRSHFFGLSELPVELRLAPRRMSTSRPVRALERLHPRKNRPPLIGWT